MDAQTCFRSMYTDFQKQLNPAEIAGDLFVAGLITETEQDEMNNVMHPARQRATTMLAALQRAIKINPENLSKFLDILEKVALYQDIATKARGMLGLQSQKAPKGMLGQQSQKAKKGMLGQQSQKAKIVTPRHYWEYCVGTLTIMAIILAGCGFYLWQPSSKDEIQIVKEPVTCTEMKPNMELFQKAALNVSPKWRLIGKHFGLPENLLDEIKLSATSKGNLYAFEMVRKAWKIYLTLNVIIRTLESPKVNEQVVAKYLNGKLKDMSAWKGNWDDLVIEIATKVGAKWRLIGEQLEIPKKDLDQIKVLAAGSLNPNVYAIQLMVKKQFVPGCNMHAFIEALKSDAVGEQLVAQDLEKTFEGIDKSFKDKRDDFSKKMAPKWRLIGEHLGKSKIDLDEIAFLETGKPEEDRVMDMVKDLNYDAWLNLIAALDNSPEMEVKAMAADLKHCVDNIAKANRILD